MGQKPRLLFICTANINRSRTAENLFKNSTKYEVQSAGINMIDGGSGQLVTQELIDWADRIFVMDEVNDHHASYILNNFRFIGKEITVLGIPDIYGRGDPKLVDILRFEMFARGIDLD